MEKLGYVQATPVQAAALPACLSGRDVLVCAPTGTGKTAAFVLSILQRWQPAAAGSSRTVQALVLVPTRELAIQVGAVFKTLAASAHIGVKTSVLYGGVSINPQLMALRGGADVVVSTPGRLLDVAAHNALHLHAVGCVVLDEADRMLDLGFSAQMVQIDVLLSKRHQRLLFSATYSDQVRALAQSRLQDPIDIHIDSPVHVGLPVQRQRAVAVEDRSRTALLRYLMEQEAWDRVLVFVATKYAAEMVADKLRRVGLRAEPFHAQLSQGKRNQVLSDFRAKHIQVVVATDVAARGVDIEALPVVVNYDLPRAPTDYVHRIGRTARAGRAGMAVSFVGAQSAAHFALIQKRNGLQIPIEVVDGFAPHTAWQPVPPDQAAGGIKGRRPSKKDKLRAAGLLPPLV